MFPQLKRAKLLAPSLNHTTNSLVRIKENDVIQNVGFNQSRFWIRKKNKMWKKILNTKFSEKPTNYVNICDQSWTTYVSSNIHHFLPNSRFSHHIINSLISSSYSYSIWIQKRRTLQPVSLHSNLRKFK